MATPRRSIRLAPTSSSSSTAGVDFSLYGGAEILPPSSLSLTSSGSSTASSDDESVETEESVSKYARAGEEWAPKVVSPPQDPNDWLWMMTEEPHRTRRKAILKAHPEVSPSHSSYTFVGLSSEGTGGRGRVRKKKELYRSIWRILSTLERGTLLHEAQSS